MVTLDDFSKWMRENSALSENSIYKYSRAVLTISRLMQEKGIITKSLLDMSLIHLDYYIPIILFDKDFEIKNTTGNKMYSNALKQYRLFRNLEVEDETGLSIITGVIENFSELQETERTALVKSRIGQGVFREELIKKYKSRCIITGINEKKLLIASHIKPWAASNNNERLSVENGLLLSPTFDKLFDCGLISFTNEGRILISTQLSGDVVDRLHIDVSTVFNLKASAELKQNLEYHRDVVFTTQGRK